MKLYGLMLAVPFLAACSSNYIVESAANTSTYQPPYSGAKAIITGKLQPGDSKFAAGRVAYITAIDGKPVLSSRSARQSDTWDSVYPISTGNRTVTATYRAGSFSAIPILMQFTAQPNRTYQLEFATDIGTQWMSDNSYVDLWIIDKATNQRVSEVIRTQPGTELTLPIYVISGN